MTAKRSLTIATLLAAGLGAFMLAAPHLGHDHDHGDGHHGHRHVHLQEAGGKPAPVGTPQRRYLDSGNCPAGSVFNVVNRGQVPIAQVFLRPSATTGGFDEERLRGRVLNANQWLELDPGVGRFDVLVLRTDGVGIAALRQNPCRISEIALRPDGTIAVR